MTHEKAKSFMRSLDIIHEILDEWPWQQGQVFIDGLQRRVDIKRLTEDEKLVHDLAHNAKMQAQRDTALPANHN